MMRTAVYLRDNSLGGNIVATALVDNLVKKLECKVDIFGHDKARQVFNNFPGVRIVEARVDNFGRNVREHTRMIKLVRSRRYDLGIVLKNSARAALMFSLGGVRRRIAFEGTGMDGLVGDLGLATSLPRDTARYRGDQYLDVMRALGYCEVSAKPVIYPTDAERMDAIKFIGDKIKSNRILVGINAGGSVPNKRWNPGKFAAAGRMLYDLKPYFLVFSGNDQAEMGKYICNEFGERGCLASGKSLGEVYSILRLCNVLISNDSMMPHLAAAAEVPTVIVWRSKPTVKEWKFSSDEHVAVTPDYECPYNYYCPKCDVHGESLCLSKVSPFEVAQRARELIKRK